MEQAKTAEATTERAPSKKVEKLKNNPWLVEGKTAHAQLNPDKFGPPYYAMVRVLKLYKNGTCDVELCRTGKKYNKIPQMSLTFK